MEAIDYITIIKQLNNTVKKLEKLRLNTTKTSNIVINFIQKNYSSKIPNPDKYNGSKKNLNNFFIRLKLKLEGNSNYFNNKK